MPAESTYAYQARDGRGEIHRGTMVATSSNEVTTRLRADGMFVIGIEVNPLRAVTELDRDQLRLNEAAKSVKREEVISFTQQLAVMLETGVPLFEAMRAFSTKGARRQFRMVLDALSHDVESGEPMSRALEKWPRVFPTMMVSLVRASEASGTLATMLRRVSDYLAGERRTIKQIRGALAYPLFMIISGVGITVFLMSFVLPRFSAMWQDRIDELPTITRWLMSISGFITNEYYWAAPLLGVLLLAFAIWLQVRQGRRVLDWCRLNVPVIGVMYRHLYITRSTRTMATLLGAGVNVLDVIDICRGVTGNLYYDDLWNGIEEGVREGRQISDAIAESTLIPPNVVSMIAAGERSGQLPEVMEKLADFSAEELERSVGTVTSMIEPLMIVIMGGIIGGIAIALLLPIMQQPMQMLGK